MLTLQAYEIQETHLPYTLFLSRINRPDSLFADWTPPAPSQVDELGKLQRLRWKRPHPSVGRTTGPESRGSLRISCSMVLIQGLHLFID